MALNNSHVLELRGLAGLIASLVLATACEAAHYTTAPNTYAVASWTDAVWQPGSTTPTPGNTYEILPGGLIQNPPGGASSFSGDALTVDGGARLRLTATSPETLTFPGVDGNAGLILNGGNLQFQGNTTLTINGQIAVTTNSLVDLGWLSGNRVITATLSGAGNLNLISWNPANSMDIQSTNNPYSGNWTVTGGYLKGTAVNSLGTGNITVGNGTLEISYDIQTPGALTLLGSNSVMVLHQDCQFSAVTINGTALPPGTYSYADLVAQFPVNFADGGSGSITVAFPTQADVQTSLVSPAIDDTQSNSTSIISTDASPIVADVSTTIDSVDAVVAPLIDTVAPAASSGVTVLVGSSSQITLSWNPTIDSGGSGLAGYRIYRGGSLLGTTTGTSYVDSGLAAGTQYCYTIVAYDNTGNNSSASAETCATTLLGISTPPDVTNQVFNEWYGPFSSWSNVKTTYGAVGDGVTDDTTAINNALANVGLGGHSPVLYFPPGTYRVTAKLYLHNRQLVEIVGHDPSDTSIKYDGATDSSYSGVSTLLHLDSAQQVLVARLTLDGNGKSKTLLSCSENSGYTYFDNANTFEDLVFKNGASGGHGVDGGFYGNGFANEGFTRCQFIGLSVGLQTWNYNALDPWMRDCLFTNCQTGVYVQTGNAHLYHSVLVDNKIDFYMSPAASYVSLVSNISIRAGTFYQTYNQGANITPTLIKGNTIIDAKTPIVMGQPGPLVMLDNVIACTNGPAVAASNSLQLDLTAIGNTFCTANWISFNGGSGMKTNLVDNSVVARGSLTFAPPVIPPAATNMLRPVLDMPTYNLNAASLQSTISSATNGTVVHIPWSSSGGSWPLTAAITVPANLDVRIVGDGGLSIFSWSGPSGGNMFTCPSPSHATFSQLQLAGNASVGALLAVTNVGTSSARIYVEDVYIAHGIASNIRLGDCPNTVVDIGGNLIPYCMGANVLLEGHGKVRMIDTDNGVNNISLVCTNGGQFYGEAIYNEGGNTTGNRILQISGNGTVTYLASVLHENIGTSGANFSRATSNAFAVANFSGTFLLGLADYLIDWYKVSGTTTGSLLIDGCSTFLSPVGNWPVLNSTSDGIVQTQNWNWNNGNNRYSDSGSASAAFTRQMYAQARAEYSDRNPMARRPGLTDVLLEKVYIQQGQNNLWVKP